MTERGIEAALAAARADVLLMSRPAGFGRLELGELRPGVRYRAIFPDRARTAPELRLRMVAMAAAGVGVRTVAEVPEDVLVVDGELAVLADLPFGVVIVRMPSLVRAATELFEQIWADAVPLAGGADAAVSAGLTWRERQLILLLAVGATDETVAEELGLSVRTVRRSVARIMARLGARSRFQAGVKAADRGWLSD